ncbi:BglG family transcription antiterminator [Cytobacillus sp. NCCP-133]|uniref:BglG family transcription antiterminator n=1 Tax=Cytobacillus sp. NCCP-133 TaxID=766848 RepID=UPI002852781E|nr:BglG family transcription antiterminator [Cytobacillus sp. NCCP-133]
MKAIYIAAREKKILDILLLQEAEVTIADLANELDVSPRTIHRDLKGIEYILKDYNLTLKKTSGIGIQLVGSEEMKTKLQLHLFNLDHNEYTPEDRQTIILSALLEAKEPLKLMALAYDLHVTIATISNDLTKVEERLTSYGLSVIRKRGYGVEIEGSEAGKRRAMSSLVLNHLDEVEFLSLIKQNIQKRSLQTVNTLTDRLLGLVDKKKLLIIEKQVEKIRNCLPYPIADSAYIGLVVHLTLAIERIQQGENIHFDQEYLDELIQTKEFQAAREITVGLEGIFQITIPESEIGYITMHLMGAKLRNHQEYSLEESSFQIGIKTQQLIQFVGEELHLELTKNLSLFQGLVVHLRPAIYRIRQNMGITNPLLEKIETDYHELFCIIEQGVQKVFPQLIVPKEEIGFLVMHFASALIGKDENEDVRALVVCSSGIGTSKILATKLRQEIPGLKQIQNISLFDLKGDELSKYDVIISTIPLKNFEGNYILVSPMLSEAETEKIRSYLKTHSLVIKNTDIVNDQQSEESVHNRKVVEELRLIQNYSAAILTLLEGIDLVEIRENLTKKAVLELACKRERDKNIIENPEMVVKELMERERSGGLGIPGTRLALFHTRSRFVTNPSFTLYRLQEPIIIETMDKTKILVKTILVMLAPQNINDQALEILSQISALIIRDKESIQQMEEESKEDIVSYLTHELNSYFDIKLKEIRSRSK